MARSNQGGMTHAQGARAPYRLTRFGAVGLVVALSVTWFATRDATATVSDPGQGTAVANVLHIDPRAGSLSIGVGLGQAIAGHQNGAAKAQSFSLDLGVVGTSLTTASCGSGASFKPSDFPQILIVEATDKNAAQGVTNSQEGGALVEYGMATVAPYAKAITTIAPISIPGLLSVSGGTATSWSGIINGERVAGATVDIGGISIAGQVTLGSMHWDVIHQSTGKAVNDGHFSIGALKIGGTSVPTIDAVAALATANTVLKNIGMEIQIPKAHLTQGIEYVDPLQIAVVPNAVRDKLLGTVLSGIQPVRQPVIDAVLKAVCKAESVLTVADITIGAISGAGSFDVQFGGVQAGTGEVSKNGFNLGLPGVNLSLPPPNLSTGSDTSGSSSVSTGYSAPPATTAAPLPSAPAATVPTAPVQQQAVRPITAIHGKRGGALAAVALGGLGLLALLAEGDRRMMRRAQRKVTFED
jgi:hypothetical protein